MHSAAVPPGPEIADQNPDRGVAVNASPSARPGRGSRLFCLRPATGRERRTALCLCGLLIVACLLIAWRNPATISVLPSCPVKAMSGLECPGCGSTRAVHHLLHLRFADAWSHNVALLVLGLPFAAILLVDLTLTLLARRRLLFAPGGRFGVALAIVIVAWAVVRNLPLEGFERLRPP